MNVIPKYKHLVLSGGSVRGISQIGAVKKLIDSNLLCFKTLQSVAGTSAGSIFGLLIVIGMDIDQIWQFVYHLNLTGIIKPALFTFLQKCGVETGEKMLQLIEDIIYKHTNVKQINFKQLYELSHIHFIVVGSCLTTKKIVYYDYVNTPDFKVSMAIRISISIPGLFTPVTVGIHQYVDGGVLNNYPMNLFAHQLSETIGILVCNEFKTDYTCPEEYFMAILNLFFYHYYQNTEHQWYANTIYIKKQVENVHMFNFNINHQLKKKLYECGLAATTSFINRTPNGIEEDDF